MFTTSTLGGQRVSICTCTQTGRHLATFTRRPGFSQYSLATEPPQVAASAQVSASGPVAPPSSCRLLSHQTLGWHHRLGHPSLPRLHCMHSRLLRATPHSSLFPSTTAPLQTLHMDVWGPDRVRGQGREHYFLLVVDDYTVRLHLCERFRQDLPVVRLPSDRDGKFSSNLSRDFSCGEGILKSFTLPASPQQNGIAERRIGLVMETLPTLRWMGEVGNASVFRIWGSRAFVRDTSADKFSARAVPCVFLGFPPDALGWQFYHPTSRRVLPSQDVTFDESVPLYSLFPYCSAPPPPSPLFLAPSPPPVDPLPGTVPVEVAVGSGAAFGGAASGGAEPGGSECECAGSGGAEPGGAEPAGVEPGGAEPAGVEFGGAESEGAESGGVEPRGTASSSPRLSPRPEPLSPQQLLEWFAQRTYLTAGGGGNGGAAAAGPKGARTRGTRAAETGSVGGAGLGRAAAGDPAEHGGAGAGDTGVGGAGAGGAGGGGAVSGGNDAGGTVRPRPYFVPLLHQVLGLQSSADLTPPLLCPPSDKTQPPLQPAFPLPAPSPFTEQTGGLTEHCEPESCPALPVRAVRTGRRVPRPCPSPVPGTHAMALRPSYVPLRVPLPLPHESSLPAFPDPEFDLARAARPSSIVASTLVAELVDFAAPCRLDYATALLAESGSASPPFVGGECAHDTDVFEDKQEDFDCLAVAVPRFASMLFAPEGDPDAPDIPTPRSYAEAITGLHQQKRPLGYLPAFNARYFAKGFSQRQGVDYFQTFSPTPKMTNLYVLLHIASQRDYELHSLDFSTAFLQGSLHEVIWLRRPRGFTGSFPAGIQTTLAALGCTPSAADPSLFLRTETSLPQFYVLVYVDNLVFATAGTEALALVKSELQKRHTCTDLGELRSYLGLQITRDRARHTITLTNSHMVHKVLQRFGFQFSSPQPTPLSTGHSLSAPPLHELVEPSGPYPELVGCFMYLMTCTRPDLAYPLSLLAHYVAPGRHRKVHWDAAKRVLRYLCSTSGMGLVLGGWGPVVLTSHANGSWVDDSATQRSSQGYTFSLGSGSVSWRSTRSFSVLCSSCEAEMFAGAMAAQELRWLTYLLTDLGEQPRSPPVRYVDNKTMIALCQEHELEHRMKHIALRYFLA
ncbi:unnamed protein product [Closterium sp. NIES-54]